MSLCSASNVSPHFLAPVITHLLVGNCLHGTSDLYRPLYTAGVQLKSYLCHGHSPAHYPPALLLCLPAPSPTHTQPDLICGAMQHTSQAVSDIHQLCVHNKLIAKVLLFAEGFKQAKTLGRKPVAAFSLSR